MIALDKKNTYTISELAKEFNISTRTIRYYEELGFFKPKRTAGGQRIFTNKERARLKLIFRGTRYGFTLDEIYDMIHLFDIDRTGIKQLEKTIEYGQQKLKEVDKRIVELTIMRKEMEKLLADFEIRLELLKVSEKERAKNTESRRVPNESTKSPCPSGAKVSP